MGIDRVRIFLKAGAGGNGCVSFIGRSKQLKATGGNGGDGGDIYIKGSAQINTLSSFGVNQEILAESGKNGMSNLKHGRKGNDKILKVPLGSIVEYLDKAGNLKNIEILDDISILIAKGGKGGIGNAFIKKKPTPWSSVSIAPENTEKIEVFIKLKIIGDIGIIGIPNAGKSSLINLITNSKSRIGEYSFTTLIPNLGMYKKYTIVDFPGIIEDANEGKGLGIQFLDHLERCFFYIHLIDISDNPIRKYHLIKKELDSYGIKKESILVLNKLEKLKKKEALKIKEEFKKIKIEVLLISVEKKVGILKMLRVLEKTYNKINSG